MQFHLAFHRYIIFFSSANTEPRNGVFGEMSWFVEKRNRLVATTHENNLNKDVKMSKMSGTKLFIATI